MNTGSEFVSAAGTRHRWQRREQYGNGPKSIVTLCGQYLPDSGVVQQRVKDCRRCYPVTPDFSSDTQAELEALKTQIQQLRKGRATAARVLRGAADMLRHLVMDTAEDQALHARVIATLDNGAAALESGEGA